MWRELPQEEREMTGNAKAEEVKHQHSKDSPDYQYQPRKPSEKKRLTFGWCLLLLVQIALPCWTFSYEVGYHFYPFGQLSQSRPRWNTCWWYFGRTSQSPG